MVTAVGVEQSNTSMVVDNKYVVKVLRKVTPGIHPEIARALVSLNIDFSNVTTRVRSYSINACLGTTHPDELPEFDDDSPRYDKLNKSSVIPMRKISVANSRSHFQVTRKALPVW